MQRKGASFLDKPSNNALQLTSGGSLAGASRPPSSMRRSQLNAVFCRPNQMAVRPMTALALLLAGALAWAGDPSRLPSGHRSDFGVPKTFALRGSVLPVEYLATYPVKDPAAILPPAARPKACRLVRAAHSDSLRRFNQDYLLRTDTPFYKLLAANYPDILASVGEGGSVVFLGKLAESLCTK